MPTTTIINGHIYITTGTVSGNDINHNTNELVDIWATKIDYNYDNPLNIIPGVVSKGNIGKEGTTRILDLKRTTESLNIAGYLADESGETAKTKKVNLLNLAKSIGGVTKRELAVVWGTTNAPNEQTIFTSPPSATSNQEQRGVFIQKIMFSETGGYVGETTDASGDTNPPERKIAVTIQLVRGKDM